MKRSFLALAAIGSLTGCGDVTAAKSAVAAQMKDPDSVKFRNIISGKGGVCGEINAKNSYGAYNGFHAFVYLTATKLVVNDPEVYTTQAQADEARRGCRARQIAQQIESESKYADLYPNRAPEVESECSKAKLLMQEAKAAEQYKVAKKTACDL